MSVSGISGNNLFELLEAQKSQSQGTQSQSGQNDALQQIEDDFSQLGQDLQSGNLTQAQQDLVTLSTALSSGSPQVTSGSANSANLNVASSSSANSSSANPIQQAFNSLQQDLQSGNLGAAQQDFATLQQALQQGLQQAGTQHHHHHHHGADSQQTNAVQQDFSSLAQALQSGNLSNAQAAFASLQQDLQQFSSNDGSNSSPTSGTSQSSSTNLNVTA